MASRILPTACFVKLVSATVRECHGLGTSGLVSLCSRASGAYVHQSSFSTVYVAFDGVELSEVGSIKEEGFVRVWADRNARWDGMLDDGILLTESTFWPWDLFLFHEVCWQRFTEYFKPGEIKLSRLFEVLKRLPIPQGSFSFFLSFLARNMRANAKNTRTMDRSRKIYLPIEDPFSHPVSAIFKKLPQSQS
jgi:hypothetical protein